MTPPIATTLLTPQFDRDTWLNHYRYQWPPADWRAGAQWRWTDSGNALTRQLPEAADELAADSRWPAFFPSPICLVTTAVDGTTVMEKVVGASIVNRFPYVVALSFCRQPLSARHYVRRTFTDAIERSRTVTLQFLPQGRVLDSAMAAIATTSEEDSGTRIARTELPTRTAITSDAPVFGDAYLVYEGRLASAGSDAEGRRLYDPPWLDVGSHRVYFFEITAIQLREDIAAGRSRIHWRSLPTWSPERPIQEHPPTTKSGYAGTGYAKPYTPHYAFPAPETIAFEPDFHRHGMAVKLLASTAADQIEADNDRARWPCFFPSSVGMISTWDDDGTPNLMPCGSTTILSRQPLVITPCVSYSSINERYARRATLDLIRRRGQFVCGVPFVHDIVVEAIRYAGNVSLRRNPSKISDAGLEIVYGDAGPLMPALPVQFECTVVGEVALGTHIMFLGEVRTIRIRPDVTAENPLRWCPWPIVEEVPDAHA